MSAAAGATRAAGAPALPHVCPRCARRYVVVPGRSIADPPACTCGGALSPAELAGGVYELRRARGGAGRRGPRAPRGPPAAREPDLGYGESHGYGPAHGGPSGPGDAPAPERAGQLDESDDRPE